MTVLTSRQRVLEFLGRRNSASAAQIGHALNMSAATVRHHLAILAADGRVIVAGVASKGKRGRPEKMYRLSEKILGEGFEVLSEALITTWLEGLPVSKQEPALEGLAEAVTAQIGKPDETLPATKRLVQLAEKLTGAHYQARWEAGADGPRVLFAHCPYAAIVVKHPELCRMDALILSQEMNANAEQLSKIEARPGGATHCVFAIRERKPMLNKS
jgi:predicted ArsR family transcriptional regulator